MTPSHFFEKPNIISKNLYTDVLQLDDELSWEVQEIAEHFNLSRQKIILEATRSGLQTLRDQLVVESTIAHNTPCRSRVYSDTGQPGECFKV